MLWNNLMCLDCFNFKTLSWKVYDSKLDKWTFKFIKILAKIINHFFKCLTKGKIKFLCLNGKGTMVILTNRWNQGWKFLKLNFELGNWQLRLMVCGWITLWRYGGWMNKGD